MFDQLNLIDWNLLKEIIFDRDWKFLFKIWTIIFFRLKIKFMYFVAYHSQTNDLFERINQTIEIVFRFLIIIFIHFNRWSEIISVIRRDFNNAKNSIIDYSSNEVTYDFISMQILDLKKFISKLSFEQNRFINRLNVANAIVFEQMNAKFHYDKKHQSLFMKKDDYAFIKLHKNYNISFVTSRKYDQQYVDSFRIIEKIDRFAYRLNISKNWRIHFVFSVTQLKFFFSSF